MCNKKHSWGICDMETGGVQGLVINSASTQSYKALLCAETVGIRGGAQAAVLYDSGQM